MEVINNNVKTDAARLLTKIASMPHFNFNIKKTFKIILINILPTFKRENNFALRSSLNFKNGITTLESKNKINADRIIKYDLSGSTSKKTVIGFLRSRIKNIKIMEVKKYAYIRS